jgi:SAM-dependent methyltransferase
MDNKQLYETDEVVAKYAANNTRLRSLNNPEKELVDRFDIKNKEVLVLGCGAGRVPINLLLYGNRVKGIDFSRKLIEIAKKNFPITKFADVSFDYGDMTDLNNIPNEYYDVVIIPMNSIDYVPEYNLREKAIINSIKKVKAGGILAFSSHNKLAYMFSPKTKNKDRSFRNITSPYHFIEESVVGGGKIFKGNPKFIIKSMEKLIPAYFQGFICDRRNLLDKILAKKLNIAQFFFPYILYVFKKK